MIFSLQKVFNHLKTGFLKSIFLNAFHSLANFIIIHKFLNLLKFLNKRILVNIGLKE